jgi:hypothetical protein
MAKERGWKKIYGCSLFDPGVLQRLGMEVTRQKILGYGQFHDTNRWFVRSWIVQEVANAGQIRVLCGKTQIPWQSIVSMSSLARITG